MPTKPEGDSKDLGKWLQEKGGLGPEGTAQKKDCPEEGATLGNGEVFSGLPGVETGKIDPEGGC